MYRLNGEWVQLFIDSALDRYANLSDLEDIEKAKSNLELAKDYWNKEELADGTHESIIHNICIMQDPNARFVTDAEKDTWNKKVDRPITSITQPENMTEGQMWYDASTGAISINVNGKIRHIESVLTKTGISTFAGQHREQMIEHGCKKSNGNGIAPSFVAIMPTGDSGGTLGEYWTRQDDTYIYVGNTGSYTGSFQWIAYYNNL
jgi:hypothetical protein